MPRGFGGGGFGRGGFGGGFGMRRGGFPLLGMGMGMMGMGMGPLMYGGLGYLLGRNSNQPQDLQVLQVQPAPGYYPQVPQAVPAPASSADTEKLSQLKLLGELRDKGILTDSEFEREKNRILGH